ncbi:hypothetical protein HHI36_013212, partial [Cryptolaemus montrouzieri]
SELKYMEELILTEESSVTNNLSVLQVVSEIRINRFVVSLMEYFFPPLDLEPFVINTQEHCPQTMRVLLSVLSQRSIVSQQYLST